jgi:hypothetical protein
MQRLFWLLNAAMLPVMYFFLPDKVAVHFDLAGHPNGWMSRIGTVAVQGIVLLICVKIWFIGFLACKNCPSEFINCPNAGFWRREENVPALHRKLGSLIWEIGAVTLTLPFFAAVFIVYVNQTAIPAAGNAVWYFIWYFTGFIITVLSVLLLRFCYVFRIPKAAAMDTSSCSK